MISFAVIMYDIGSKCPATKYLAFHGQSNPLFVGEPKPLSFELLLEHTVLFDEIVDDRLLVSVKPTGQCDYEEVERLYDMGHQTNRLSVILFDNNIIPLVRFFAPYDLLRRNGRAGSANSRAPLPD